MDVGDGINLAGVIISGASAIWAWRSASSAKAAEQEAEDRAEAALKAERAAVAAQRDIAEQLKRVADTDDQHTAELDADPWSLEPIPGSGDCNLINRTHSAKYGVTVTGYKVHEGPVHFERIGPGKSVEVGINRIWADENDVQITWHQRQDRSDEPATTTEPIPSRI